MFKIRISLVNLVIIFVVFIYLILSIFIFSREETINKRTILIDNNIREHNETPKTQESLNLLKDLSFEFELVLLANKGLFLLFTIHLIFTALKISRLSRLGKTTSPDATREGLNN